MSQTTEKPSKDHLQNTIAAASNTAENVISLDQLKEIDEEVQYAIATYSLTSTHGGNKPSLSTSFFYSHF